jgi:hypothetical protein
MSEPTRIGGGDLLETLKEAADKYGDGKTYPTDEFGRLRICSRCESKREEFEKWDPTWVPGQCHSYVRNGRHYWLGTCFPCSEIEMAQRKAAKEAAEKAEDPSPKPTIGMRHGVSWKPQKSDWRDP